MSASRILLVTAGIVLVVCFGSDWLLRSSSAFWEMALAEATRPEEQALQLEARLRTRSPEEAALLFLGNSLVRADIDRARVAGELRLSSRQVELLWLPASSGLEMAMLTPDLVELRPRAVVYLLTVWNLYAPVDLDQVRLYSASFAARLYELPQLFHDRAVHAAKLIESQHVVWRHRDPLRRILFRNALRTPDDLRTDDRMAVFRSQRDAAARSDFACENTQTHALELMARELSDAGVQVLFAATPVNYAWGADPQLRAMLDDCFGGLAREVGFRYRGIAAAGEFRPDDFGDDLHLSLAGRRTFTSGLLPELRKLLEGARD